MVLPEAPIADDPTPWTPNPFYLACSENDIKKAYNKADFRFLSQGDNDGNTPLHIASMNGYTEILELLFRFHADLAIRNKQGKTAEEVAKNDDIKNVFKTRMPSKLDPKQLVSTTVDVEWIDSYKNAYRIAYENREHMKRWLLKVPLDKLLGELLTGYIEKISFSTPAIAERITTLISQAKEYEHPVALLYAYTSDGGFCTRLNYDLAEIGSNFRFLSTQNLFNSGYLDNEAPKGLGQHIFAAIMMNHPFFQQYHRTDTTLRGMNITPGELNQYKVGDYVLTRSFLSTSKTRRVADIYKGEHKDGVQVLNAEGKLPVLCVYTTKNPRSGLCISDASVFEQEKEVLIVPFVVFEVIRIELAKIDENGDWNPVTIYFEERDSNIS